MSPRTVTVSVLGALFLLAVIAGATVLTAPGRDAAAVVEPAIELLDGECSGMNEAPAGGASEAPPDVSNFIDCLQTSGYGEPES